SCQGPRHCQRCYGPGVDEHPVPQCFQATAWCFPLPPQSRSKSQTDPASEGDQHFWRFAESEIASPTPHVRSQFCYRRIDADALCPSSDLSYSMFEAIQSFRRNDALNFRTVAKTESEKLPLLRSRYRTLRLIHFEFELLRDNRFTLSITRCPARSLRT